MYIQNTKNNARPTPIPPQEMKQPIMHNEFLNRHIGRRVRVEYATDNAINELYGQLINVGKDFIMIKLPSKPLSTAVFQNDKINKIIIQFEEN